MFLILWSVQSAWPSSNLTKFPHLIFSWFILIYKIYLYLFMLVTLFLLRPWPHSRAPQGSGSLRSFQTLSSNHHAHPKRPLPRSSSPPASGWMIPAVNHRTLLTSHLHLLHPCIVIMLWFHPPPTSSPQHLDVTVTMATCTHPPPPLQVTGCYLTVCLGGRDVDQVSNYLPVLVDQCVCLLCWCVICHRLLRAARVCELWDAERPPVEARRCRSTPV